MQYKSISLKENGLEIEADPEKNEFSGHAAVIDIVDKHDERIRAGAFLKSIEEKFPANQIKTLWQHDSWEPIGVPTHLDEDEKGLAFTSTVDQTSRGKDVMILLRSGTIDQMSIGFNPVATRDDPEDKVRDLLEVDLWEISPVTFAASPSAIISDVKAAEVVRLLNAPYHREWVPLELARLLVRSMVLVKSVVGYQNLPLADRTVEWDASAAAKRVREWAEADEEPNAKYRKAFLWYDSEASETFGAYKLPIADVVGDTLTAIPRGVFAAAGAIQGARGGVKIPDGDTGAIKSHIARYYAKMRKRFDDDSIVPPWDKSALELDHQKLILARELIDQVFVVRNLEHEVKHGREEEAADLLVDGLLKTVKTFKQNIAR